MVTSKLTIPFLPMHIQAHCRILKDSRIFPIHFIKQLASYDSRHHVFALGVSAHSMTNNLIKVYTKKG